MSKFTDSIDSNLAGIDHVATGLASCCGECCSAFGLDEDEMREGCETGAIFDEGGFSSSGCDSCGSNLAGDLFAAHGFDKHDDVIHLDICVDCLLFHANGDEPEEGTA